MADKNKQDQNFEEADFQSEDVQSKGGQASQNINDPFTQQNQTDSGNESLEDQNSEEGTGQIESLNDQPSGRGSSQVEE